MCRFYLTTFILVFAMHAQAVDVPAIIPQPAELQVSGGEFRITAATRVFVQGDGECRAVADYLAEYLEQLSGYHISVSADTLSGTPPEHAIVAGDRWCQARAR